MKILPKIVLDTNILVSALRSSGGPSFALVMAIRSGNLSMCCSPALFLEYEDVLKRPEQLEAAGLALADVDKWQSIEGLRLGKKTIKTIREWIGHND